MTGPTITTTAGAVFVAGAAGGNQGSTGRRVAGLLLERGVPVRAFVHREDARADELRRLGADVVAGDLRDIASVRPALRGARRAFFTYPVREGMLDAAAAFAAAAREHALEQVVAMSQLTPAPEGMTRHMRQHWVAEQVLDWAGVGAIHLRAPVFHENLRSLISADDDADQLVLPLGGEDTRLPFVGAADVARVAAEILASPRVHAPGHLRLVTEVPAVADITAAYAAALGRPLRYVAVPGSAWRDAVLRRGLDPHAVEHLTQLWEIFATSGPRTGDGALVQPTDTIERITGRPPQTLDAFLRAVAD